MTMPTAQSKHHKFAQYVAFNFVRHYYTVMNENPGQLHKLYCDDSTFVHSGLDQPGQKVQSVIGQKDPRPLLM
ncbi:hypothetical protein TNCV_2229391 [Trichonephila clavipes]|nr:hypothetical protein TNCV_2229391 [Trichonephila clavipes]